LEHADLSDALAGWTDFGNLDLRFNRGLNRVRHRGPSSVGIDTLYRSGRGKIPQEFLLGAGVPQGVIENWAKLIGNPAQYFSCFISYSTREQSFAEHLHADLQLNGVRCWFSPHDVKGGRKLHEQIDEAIHIYDRLLLILSDQSMASEWVRTEISKARQRELTENRQMLFPISLVPYDKIKEWKAFDADTGKDSARRFGSISFLISATGRTTIATRPPFSGC
jgi:hypothetical protein